ATIHWQFSPPAPPTRDTAILDASGALVHDPRLFTDYIINITNYSPTPTFTNTPTPIGTGIPGIPSVPLRARSNELDPCPGDGGLTALRSFQSPLYRVEVREGAINHALS